MPICLLVRHGRTSANASGTLAGWTPGVALDDTGREQVVALAARLTGIPVVRVVSSPLQRCRETAEILARELGGLDVMADDGLGECRYGAWTGRPLAELAKEPLWRTVQDQPSAVSFPDGQEFPGETMTGMASRAVSAVRRHDTEVEQDHGPNALWLAVSHGDVLKAVLADAAGAHLDQFQRIVADPASLSVVHYTARRPFVVRVNDSGSDLHALVAPPEVAAADGDAAVGGGTGPPGDGR